MSKISEHMVYTRNGESTLLGWLGEHKHRHYTNGLNDSEVLQKIARIDDDDARHLLLSVFGSATHFRDMVVEMHTEFDTLLVALQRIADEEAPAPERDAVG